MTSYASHSGVWDRNLDIINVLGSKDQYIVSNYTFLGLDTEMLITRKRKVVWPWEADLPQERNTNSSITSDLTQRFDFHGDGYATELCVPPSTCLEEILSCLGSAFRWLHKKNGMAKISSPAIFTIPEKIIKQSPDEAKQLGCMPSNNVYGDGGSPGSLPYNQRTTGCHLHISHPILKNEDTCIALVKWADILVGCAWTYISPNSSKDESSRRIAYGRAGEYRLKQYSDTGTYSQGVEYRVLPGTPIQHPAYLTLMFSLYRSALRLANNYGDPKEELSMQARKAINNASKIMAAKVLASLPLSEESFGLIKVLHKKPLDVKDASAWATLGLARRGHQYYYSIDK